MSQWFLQTAGPSFANALIGENFQKPLGVPSHWFEHLACRTPWFLCQRIWLNKIFSLEHEE